MLVKPEKTIHFFFWLREMIHFDQALFNHYIEFKDTKKAEKWNSPSRFWVVPKETIDREIAILGNCIAESSEIKTFEKQWLSFEKFCSYKKSEKCQHMSY